MNAINGYVLFMERALFVRGYLGILGFIGISIGWWGNSIILSTFSAFLLGAYFSPWLPVWKTPISEHDKKVVELNKAGPTNQLKYYYWLIPIVVLAMVGMVIFAKLNGYES